MTRRSGSELKRLAREFLLGNCSAVMAAMLTASFLPAVLLLPFSTELTTGLNVAVVTYLIAAIILKLLGQLLSAGVLRMHLLLAQEQRPAFRDLFWTFRNRPDRFILASGCAGRRMYLLFSPGWSNGTGHICGGGRCGACILRTVSDLYV